MPTILRVPSLLLLLIAALGSMPARASQWEPLPLWGDAVRLAAGRDPAIVYAVAPDRIFESLDGGRTWQLVASGTNELYFKLLSGGAFEVDPQDSRVLFVTDPSPFGNGQRVLRSEDGGRTWVRSDEGMAGQGVTHLAFGPAASGVLYAATSKGLYRSKDRGTSWSLLAFPGQFVGHVAVAPSDPRIVLASGSNKTTDWTARSTDRGRTFVRVSRTSIEKLAFDPSRPRRVIGVSLTGKASLVRSDDLGAHWKVLSSLPNPLRTLEFTPAGALLAAGEVGGVSRSLNGGVTWSPPLTDLDRRPLDVVSSLVALEDAVLAGGEHGVWRSGKAGRIWRLSNQGIQNKSIQAWTVADDSTLWVGTRSGLFFSRDLGETFQVSGEGMGPRGRVRRLTVHPADPETAYAIGCCVDSRGLSTVGMLKTEDGGRSWRALPYPVPEFDVLVLEIDPVDPDGVYAGGFNDLTPGDSCRAWRSMDGGETWACIAPQGFDFVGLAIDPHDRRILYGLFNGDLYYSEDQGTSWTKRGDADFVMFSIEADPFQADRLYIKGNGNSVHRSDDGGRTWSLKLQPPSPPFYGLAYWIDPSRPGRIWAVRGDQILRSEDAGDSWTEAGSLLGPDGRIFALTLDPRLEIFYGVGESTGRPYRGR